VFYMTVQEYDVVVVGSGAAGMVAALTAAHQGLSTVVVEKAPHYGGSTARSGGGVWVPNNEILKRDGVTDTPEAARTYLHTIIGDVVEPERIDTYLDRGPEMGAHAMGAVGQRRDGNRFLAGGELAAIGPAAQVRVLDSGTDRRGQWVEQRVNAREDYLKYFDEKDVPKAAGIAVLTDSDDTKSSAQGDYANFRVCKE